jgi:hypothetical protein
MPAPLNVVCVLKTPSSPHLRYDAGWVQKLQRGVARHLHVPHRFVCLSDMTIPDVTVEPLRHDWMLFWSKIEMFRPGLFTGPTLYFDIDAMITGNIDALAGPFDGMVMLTDFYPAFRNSGLLWWDAADPRFGVLYQRLLANPFGTMLKHRYKAVSTGNLNYGDQEFIADTMTELGIPLSEWQKIMPKDWFLAFCFEGRLNPVLAQPPADTRMCYCLGGPKFDQYPQLPLVTANWI